MCGISHYPRPHFLVRHHVDDVSHVTDRQDKTTFKRLAN